MATDEEVRGRTRRPKHGCLEERRMLRYLDDPIQTRREKMRWRNDGDLLLVRTHAGSTAVHGAGQAKIGKDLGGEGDDGHANLAQPSSYATAAGREHDKGLAVRISREELRRCATRNLETFLGEKYLQIITVVVVRAGYQEYVGQAQRHS
jgi:hypothetical protein